MVLLTRQGEAVLKIAGSAKFSSDRAIAEYAASM
jgi:hypothetical protein